MSAWIFLPFAAVAGEGNIAREAKMRNQHILVILSIILTLPALLFDLVAAKFHLPLTPESRDWLLDSGDRFHRTNIPYDLL